jgi:hypothetical protein
MVRKLKFESLLGYLPGRSRSVGLAGTHLRPKHKTIESLVYDHFVSHSSLDHLCRSTLHEALAQLNCLPSVIVETGTAAWGTKSSLLFDSYVNSFGGTFESVDIRRQPARAMHLECTDRSRFWTDDSISFLTGLVTRIRHIDLVYLDSKDVDWNDPLPSAIHGFHEFLVLLPLLQKCGGLLLIDDTPRDAECLAQVSASAFNSFSKTRETYGFAPGKGSLVLQYLKEHRIGKLVKHEDQLLWSFR